MRAPVAITSWSYTRSVPAPRVTVWASVSMRGDRVDHQLDVLVEQAALGPDELLGVLAAHGDVHVARLVGVGTGRVDDRHPGLAVRDLALELAGSEVGGEGPADAATEDDDALHRRYLTFSTTISS